MRPAPVLSLVLLLGCPPAPDSGDPGDTRDTDTRDTDPVDTGPHDTGETPTCVPNGDGRIEWSEFVADPSLGIRAIYTTNTPGSTVTVPSVGGTDMGDGLFSWDFSATGGPNETQWTVALGLPSDAWFADRFPSATYTVGLDASEEVLGVYRVDEDTQRLELLGLASADEATGDVLIYAQPVVVFDFPLAVGNRWTNDQVQADGHWEGEDYPADFGWHGTVTLQHSYTFEVDRAGSLEAPLGGFEVLRVRADQRMEAVNSLYGTFADQSLISYFWVAECAGLVARIRSTPDQRDPDFDQASEYMRLGF